MFWEAASKLHHIPFDKVRIPPDPGACGCGHHLPFVQVFLGNAAVFANGFVVFID